MKDFEKMRAYMVTEFYLRYGNTYGHKKLKDFEKNESIYGNRFLFALW